MNHDQVKGRISNINGLVKEVVRETGGDESTENKDTAKQLVGKKQAVYGDLKGDRRRLWVMY